MANSVDPDQTAYIGAVCSGPGGGGGGYSDIFTHT